MSKKMLCIFICSLLPFHANAAQTCDVTIPKTQSDSIYIDYADGTVLDTETGLMWQKCSVGQTYDSGQCLGVPVTKNWKDSLEAAKLINVNNGIYGFNDWRLPSIAELVTLVEFACWPPINESVFPSTAGSSYPDGVYWSSTPAYTAGTAWEAGGWIIPNDKNVNRYVRLVRRGR